MASIKTTPSDLRWLDARGMLSSILLADWRHDLNSCIISLITIPSGLKLSYEYVHFKFNGG